MNFGGPLFVLAIVGMSMAAWIITTAIRARHGYPIENEWGGLVTPRDTQASEKLASENAELKATVAKLEDRLKVLERIATDPAKRLAEDIDELR